MDENALKMNPAPIDPPASNAAMNTAASNAASTMNTATTPPANQPAQPPVKEGSNKLILATVAMLLLGLGLLGGYFIAASQNITPTTEKTAVVPSTQPTAVPTINPTADWTQYTSKNNEYTVKYPSETFLRYICPNEELTLTVRKAEVEESITMPTCNRGGRYEIEIATLTQAFTEPQSSTNYSVVKQPTTVDGNPATKYITTLTQQPANGDMAIPYSQDIYVTKNGKTYLLHVGSENLVPTFEKILSTFKFLN